MFKNTLIFDFFYDTLNKIILRFFYVTDLFNFQLFGEPKPVQGLKNTVGTF